MIGSGKIAPARGTCTPAAIDRAINVSQLQPGYVTRSVVCVGGPGSEGGRSAPIGQIGVRSTTGMLTRDRWRCPPRPELVPGVAGALLSKPGLEKQGRAASLDGRAGHR
jgi:hypothetical protein